MSVADRGRILVSTHLFPRTPSPERAHPSAQAWIWGSHYLGRMGSSPQAAWEAQSRSWGMASPHSSPLQAGKTGISQPCHRPALPALPGTQWHWHRHSMDTGIPWEQAGGLTWQVQRVQGCPSGMKLWPFSTFLPW